MPRRLRDPNVRAKLIVDIATDEETDSPEERNIHAVELGRFGGQKSGPRRASKLRPKRRKEIVRKAAKARWEGSRRSYTDSKS